MAVQADGNSMTAHGERVLEAMNRAADCAASALRAQEGNRAALEWRSKGHADFVSDADIEAEGILRHELRGAFADATILGEELSGVGVGVGVGVGEGRGGDEGEHGSEGLRFVVDPLDGTTNFLHGYPWYAISIAAFSDGAPLAALVLDVPRGDVATAIAGRGARWNGVPMSVSRIDEPARALIGTGFPFKHLHLLEDYQHQFVAVMRRTAGIRRAGSAALDLTDVAHGRFDGFWELALEPWDFAAGMILVREAGGVVTDLEGAPPSLESSAIVAGNPAVHRWLLQTLTSDPEIDWT